MKRRTVFQSLVGVSALTPALVPALQAQTAPSSTTPAADDVFKIDLTSADAVATPEHSFFTAQQYASLERLCDLLMPAHNNRPSAKQAEVPQFLDFLLSASPAGRQVLYSQGLDQLDIDARRQQGKAFAALSDAEAASLLAPLRAAWNWASPSQLLPRFLREAKNDVLRATSNSKAWANAAAGSRRATGVNTYWDVIE
ncbi:MAG TPA: gluconate 2-dehydrogenase subunit 3 family protein [Bryobacteraceae bacterium]|nr:gluconate 2-dehydrogenase subunit 3 family protein [Bryobacteraceae bacterium]